MFHDEGASEGLAPGHEARSLDRHGTSLESAAGNRDEVHIVRRRLPVAEAERFLLEWVDDFVAPSAHELGQDAERCAEELAHVWFETRGALRWLSRELQARVSP